ncbi:hypothetical protein F2Q70_00043578 [Brassica cretica]|uniref:Uncharacterized protein n=1 Tax=Brassica cretica TaxID=69181 RepID=A0A8S9KD59_BRACR|nr:hypothetical protein F2Q70_00043578 [Brassica cretica]
MRHQSKPASRTPCPKDKANEHFELPSSQVPICMFRGRGNIEVNILTRNGPSESEFQWTGRNLDKTNIIDYEYDEYNSKRVFKVSRESVKKQGALFDVQVASFDAAQELESPTSSARASDETPFRKLSITFDLGS